MGLSVARFFPRVAGETRGGEGLKSRDQGLKVPYVNDGPPAGPAGPTRRPSPMPSPTSAGWRSALDRPSGYGACAGPTSHEHLGARSEEHTSELQSRENLVCRL